MVKFTKQGWVWRERKKRDTPALQFAKKAKNRNHRERELMPKDIAGTPTLAFRR